MWCLSKNLTWWIEHSHSLQNPFPKKLTTPKTSSNFPSKQKKIPSRGHGHHFPPHPLPSHPCHSQLPLRKVPFRGHGLYCPRPPPQRRPPAAAGPRCRGRCLLHGAATSSLGAPAGVADAEGPVSCMVRWFFPSETMPKRWKSLFVWPQGLDITLLLHHIHHSCQNMCITSHHSNVHLLSMHWPEKIWPCKFIKLSLYWKTSLTTLQSWAVGKLCAALFYPAKAFIQNYLIVGYSCSF